MKAIYLGKEVELEEGANGFMAAKALDNEHKKEDIALRIDGNVFDMSRKINEGDFRKEDRHDPDLFRKRGNDPRDCH